MGEHSNEGEGKQSKGEKFSGWGIRILNIHSHVALLPCPLYTLIAFPLTRVLKKDGMTTMTSSNDALLACLL